MFNAKQFIIATLFFIIFMSGFCMANTAWYKTDTQVYDTNSKGHYQQAITHCTFGKQFYYFNNKTYFVWMSSVADGCKTYVSYYDHITGNVAASVLVHTPVNADAHGHAGMIIADDGSIIVAVERLDATPPGTPSNSHPSTIAVYKSDLPENISAFTNVTDVGGVDEIVNKRSYPQLNKVGSRIYLILRDARPKLYLYYSDDNGTTWSGSVAGTNIVDLGQPSYHWAYTSLCVNSDDKIRLVINQSDSEYSPQASRYSYYLESFDGDTFTNVSGTYSHKVSVSGAITETLLQANYLVKDSGSTTVYVSADAVFKCSETGRIFFLIRNFNNSNGVINSYNLSYWDGSAWQYKNTNLTPYTVGVRIFAYNDNTIDLWGIFGTGIVSRYRTENAGDSWAKVEDIGTGAYPSVWMNGTDNATQFTPLLIATTYQTNGTVSGDILLTASKYYERNRIDYRTEKRSRYK